jgi:hypothetical protein
VVAVEVQEEMVVQEDNRWNWRRRSWWFNKYSVGSGCMLEQITLEEVEVALTMFKLEANGGSGVVILRMADADYSSTTTGSPTVNTNVGGSGETVLIFNSSGSYTA